MKKYISILCFATFLIFGATTMTSCSKKTGCPINENVKPKADKNGNFKRSKTKSGLFPKKRGKRG